MATNQRDYYPEVTGYYIPTLIKCGEMELAHTYASSLLSRQGSEGAWYDPSEKNPFIFDTAQVLKGLIEVKKNAEIDLIVDEAIIKAIDWMLSCMNQEGRLVTPNDSMWGRDDHCNEMIHMYAISPILEAGTIIMNVLCLSRYLLIFMRMYWKDL